LRSRRHVVGFDHSLIRHVARDGVRATPGETTLFPRITKSSATSSRLPHCEVLSEEAWTLDDTLTWSSPQDG
jgi:hypothetical protein